MITVHLTIPQSASPTAFSESGHPFVSYADIFPNREITLYTREAFLCEAQPQPLHKGGNQFQFLALLIILTNCKALFSIFLLEVAELNMHLRKRQLTFDALRDCRADKFCQLQQGFRPFCGLALTLCNLLNSANGHSNSYLFTIVS